MSYIRSRKHPVSQQPRVQRAVAAAIASLAVPGISGTAQAQTTLPEIKVQSNQVNDYKADTVDNPKYTRPISETPQTITVIKKEILQEQSATTLAEALRNTPGVTMLMGENGNTATGDSIFMRGFDTQGSIFIDGVRDVGTYSRDTFNVEQVEVVKGPAGADIGRGSPTGYINLISKVPLQENFAAGSLGVSSAPWGRATADLNRTSPGLGAGTAFRLNVMKQQGDVPGRDHVTNDAWGVAPSFALGLGTPTRVYLSAMHLERDARPDGGLPTVGLPGYYNANLAAAGVRAARADTSNYYGSLSDHDRVDVDMFTVRIEHDLSSGLKLRNTSRYGRSKQDFQVTGVFDAAFPDPANPASWNVELRPQGKLQRNEVITNQTNVSTNFATGGIRHTVSGGVEFIYEKQTNTTLARVGDAGTQSLYNPSTNIAFSPVLPTGGSSSGNTTTVAAYATDTLAITDKLEVTGGLRLDKYRTETVSIPDSATANQTATSLSKSDTLKTWKLGALYKLAPNGNVYAAYGYAEKPPGSDTFTLNAGAPNATTGIVNANTFNLEPQEASNIELGTKWDLLGNRLAVTAALFRTENKNDVAQQDAVTGEITQFGKRRVQGLELGAVGQITPNWLISAGLARMDTKVLQAASTQATQQGAAINWSPKLAITAWTSYRLPMGLTIGGGARYLSSQQRQVNNTVTATTNMPEIDSYVVFDAMASYEINRNFSLQLNVFNLADKFYVASLNNAGNRYTLGTPRYALLSANLKF
jgi:catecholate siderophore receptor